MINLTSRLGQPDFPLAGLQLLYGGDNMVTKLDVCDKVFIVGSNISKKQVQKRTGFRSPYDYL